MAIYKFRILDGNDIEHGPFDFPDDAAAWDEATSFCGQVLKDELKPAGGFTLLVTDQNGSEVFQIAVKAS